MPFSFEVKKKNKNQTELKDIFCLKSSQQINSDSFSFPLTQKTAPVGVFHLGRIRADEITITFRDE